MTEKSKTQYVQIKGELNWAKVFEENRDLNGPNGAWTDSNGRTSIEITVDEENKAILDGTKSQKKWKETDDGRYSMQLSRKWEAPYNYGGAPRVVRADGLPWDIDEDGLIGNGSVGVLYLSVYPTSAGLWGTRLDAVQVIDHVVFESEGSGGFKFVDYTKTDIPEKETKKVKPRAKAKPAPAVEDEIPFNSGEAA